MQTTQNIMTRDEVIGLAVETCTTWAKAKWWLSNTFPEESEASLWELLQKGQTDYVFAHTLCHKEEKERQYW
jgi:hypothetical protein